MLGSSSHTAYSVISINYVKKINLVYVYLHVKLKTENRYYCVRPIVLKR